MKRRKCFKAGKRYTSDNLVSDQGNEQSRHMKKHQELEHELEQEQRYENGLCKEGQRAWVREGASKG